MTAFSLDSATTDQLREYATTVGVDVPPNIKDDTLRARIRETLGEVQKVEEPKKTKSNPEKSMWVRIQNDGMFTGPVSLTHNGTQALVARNEWVEIPFKYFEVLRLAVTHDVNGMTGDITSRPTYPFQYSETKPSEAGGKKLSYKS